MGKLTKMIVQGTEIVVFKHEDQDYISLTDIARHKDPEEPKDIVKNWMRTKGTIEFLGLWEAVNNPDFKGVEFDSFRNEAGSNSFVLSPQKWVEETHAIGIRSKSGNQGGTFAHKDIAFEFASWLSPAFKLFIIKEFQRLKEEENEKMALGWDLKRNLARINYRIHTDAIKQHLLPVHLTPEQMNFTYASEADVLNKALFGMTAKEWRDANPDFDGNIRDYASAPQLVCLSNLEALNAEFIRQKLTQPERLQKLNEIAIVQMQSLLKHPTLKRLKKE